MKFGIFSQLQMPRPWAPDTERRLFWDTLDQFAAAEQAGFEYAWLPEMHFFAEIGHCSSPEMLLAALSQRTTSMRLGFAVVVTSVHNPAFIVERVSTLDVLSRGRAEFGVGRGSSSYVVEGLGFDPAADRDVSREVMEAALEMFKHERFPGYDGQHIKMPPRYVLPRPIQTPHPPLWLAASTFDTYEKAASLGAGVIGVA